MTLLTAWALLSGTPLPPTMEATTRLIGCIAVLNLHHPSVKHSFKDIQDLAWYKTNQKLHHETGITFIYALEYLICGVLHGHGQCPLPRGQVEEVVTLFRDSVVQAVGFTRKKELAVPRLFFRCSFF